MEKKNIYNNALEKYLHYSLSFRRRKKKQITKDNTVILSKVDILGMDKVIEASEPKMPNKEYHPKNVIQNIKNYTNIAKKIKEVNQNLAAYSQIKSFRIHDEEFAKTPKRSIKRFQYMEKE